MQQRKLYVEDVATLFVVDKSTARRWAREGKLPAVKQGRRWVFNPKKLPVTWNAVMGGRKPSTKPGQDFRQLLWLVERIDRGDVAVFEEEQRDVLDLMLGLLTTELKDAVWSLIQCLRGNPAFAFLELVPKMVPIH